MGYETKKINKLICIIFFFSVYIISSYPVRKKFFIIKLLVMSIQNERFARLTNLDKIFKVLFILYFSIVTYI